MIGLVVKTDSRDEPPHRNRTPRRRYWGVQIFFVKCLHHLRTPLAGFTQSFNDRIELLPIGDVKEMGVTATR
jgi:hypothetical protein